MTYDQARHQQELRQYYRIDDVVSLSYQVLDTDEAGATFKGSARSGLEVSTNTVLAEIDREFNEAVNVVCQHSPVIGRALRLLNRKLSMVAAQVLEQEAGDDAQAQDDAKVNLSGCGIAFEARQAIAVDARLRLSLILKPAQVAVSIAGTVIACEERLDDSAMPYRVRVKFDDDAQAQEQLIRHVVEKQVAQMSDKNARRR